MMCQTLRMVFHYLCIIYIYTMAIFPRSRIYVSIHLSPYGAQARKELQVHSMFYSLFIVTVFI